MSSHAFFSKKQVLVIPRSSLHQGFYGRMFRKLPPHVPAGANEAEQEQTLLALAATMQELESQAASTTGDNGTIPAGYTYFGQFVDHDITFDPSSSLDRFNDPNILVNFRSPRYDLDSIYGRGPGVDPHMYDQEKAGPSRFSGFLMLGQGTNPAEGDLPRNDQQTALIGDPRNDENIIVSQIQFTFLNFHNNVLQRLLDMGMPHDPETFAEAQRIVRWHYQWVVIHDFLRRIVDSETFDDICPSPESPRKPNLRFYNPKIQSFMPVEFSGAAYRLGHSMVRSEYSLNDTLENIRGKIPIFLSQSEFEEPSAPFPPHLRDLRGGRSLPGLWTLQWDRFLEMADENGTLSNPQRSRRLDTKLTFRLSNIPAGPGVENPLAALNLRRGWRFELPSGQSIARAMGIDPAHKPYGDDPLWFYILDEADAQGNGEKLGKVGSRIVAEVFWGLLCGDPLSYIASMPNWTPQSEQRFTIPAEDPAHFQLRDIVRFAGMPITANDIQKLFAAPPAPPTTGANSATMATVREVARINGTTTEPVPVL